MQRHAFPTLERVGSLRFAFGCGRRARSDACGDKLKSLRTEAERGLLAALAAEIEILVRIGSISRRLRWAATKVNISQTSLRDS